jgi:hypothetical protein
VARHALTSLSKISQAVKDGSLLARNAIPSIQANIAAVQNDHKLQLHETVMQWLSPSNFTTQQHGGTITMS